MPSDKANEACGFSQSYREELNSQLADFFPDLVEPDNSTTAGNSQHSEVDPVKPEGATI